MSYYHSRLFGSSENRNYRDEESWLSDSAHCSTEEVMVKMLNYDWGDLCSSPSLPLKFTGLLELSVRIITLYYTEVITTIGEYMYVAWASEGVVKIYEINIHLVVLFWFKIIKENKMRSYLAR